MQRFVFWALVAGHAVNAIALSLGAVYAWLWLVVLSIEHLGLGYGSIVVVLSFLGLVKLFHLARQPLLSWYHPWDHGYWIMAERISGHWWQRPAQNGAH
ncbi:MAG: hypothetical protein AAF495_24740 [Pseudomonadota bacterium]